MTTIEDAIEVSEKALRESARMEANIVGLMDLTLQLAEFSTQKINLAILQVTGGNKMAALMTLAELRLKFDRFIEQTKATKGSLKPATGEI